MQSALGEPKHSLCDSGLDYSFLEFRNVLGNYTRRTDCTWNPILHL